MVHSTVLTAQPDQMNAMRGLGRFRRRLGTEMCEILPGLYLGSIRDATDEEQLKRNRIKALVSVHDLTASHPLHSNLRVLRLSLSDCPSVDISKHFSETNDFIHEARMRDEAVLVHCLAGVSRSAAVVVAYLLTVTDLSYFSALSLVATRRPLINPNFGFRMQLAKFAEKHVKRERDRLRTSIGSAAFDLQWTADKLAINGVAASSRSRSQSAVETYEYGMPTSASSSSSAYSARKGAGPLSLFQQHRLRRSFTQGTGGAPVQLAAPRQSHPFVQSVADLMGRMSFIDD